MEIKPYNATVHKVLYNRETKQYSKYDEIFQVNAYTAEDVVTQVRIKMENEGLQRYYLTHIEPVSI